MANRIPYQVLVVVKRKIHRLVVRGVRTTLAPENAAPLAGSLPIRDDMKSPCRESSAQQGAEQDTCDGMSDVMKLEE
jgi:hypothetical protein